MGLIEVSTILTNSQDSRKSMEVKGLVDTGATLTVIPREVAMTLGISSKTSARVMTAGGPVKVDISNLEIELGGKKETIRIAISDVIDRVLIGVTTLEILGFAVDQVTNQLKESMYLLY